jgi:hypothetical protein
VSPPSRGRGSAPNCADGAARDHRGATWDRAPQRTTVSRYGESRSPRGAETGLTCGVTGWHERVDLTSSVASGSSQVPILTLTCENTGTVTPIGDSPCPSFSSVRCHVVARLARRRLRQRTWNRVHHRRPEPVRAPSPFGDSGRPQQQMPGTPDSRAAHQSGEIGHPRANPLCDPVPRRAGPPETAASNTCPSDNARSTTVPNPIDSGRSRTGCYGGSRLTEPGLHAATRTATSSATPSSSKQLRCGPSCLDRQLCASTSTSRLAHTNTGRPEDAARSGAMASFASDVAPLTPTVRGYARKGGRTTRTQSWFLRWGIPGGARPPRGLKTLRCFASRRPRRSRGRDAAEAWFDTGTNPATSPAAAGDRSTGRAA